MRPPQMPPVQTGQMVGRTSHFATVSDEWRKKK